MKASVPFPKFASFAALSVANFGIDKDTSKCMLLVRFVDLKFLIEVAAR